jgi:hypothetical protein
MYALAAPRPGSATYGYSASCAVVPRWRGCHLPESPRPNGGLQRNAAACAPYTRRSSSRHWCADYNSSPHAASSSSALRAVTVT